MAASHVIVDGKAVVDASIWRVPRTLNPTGGLISSVARPAALRRASTWATGRRLTAPGCSSPKSLVEMRTNPGPAGPCSSSSTGWG